MAAGAASVWTDSPSDALPSHFSRMGFSEALGKSFINDWNKQMHGLFCSGSKCLYLYCHWMLDLFWLKVLKDRKGFTHSLWQIFPLLNIPVLVLNVKMYSCFGAVLCYPLIVLSSSVCPHCSPLSCSFGWARYKVICRILLEKTWQIIGEMLKNWAGFSKAIENNKRPPLDSWAQTHFRLKLLSWQCLRDSFCLRTQKQIYFNTAQNQQGGHNHNGSVKSNHPRVVRAQSKYTCYC